MVYSHTYQHGLGVGFSDSGIEREVTTFALARGWFRGFVLYVEGQPCAFWHGIRYGRVFTTGATGYDPAFRDHRIGTYVLGRMVEELCGEDDLEWIDFGFGDAEYKSHFGDDRWLEEDVFVWAKRVRPVVLNGARTTLLAVDRSAKSSWSPRPPDPGTPSGARPGEKEKLVSRRLLRAAAIVVAVAVVLLGAGDPGKRAPRPSGGDRRERGHRQRAGGDRLAGRHRRRGI